MSMIEKLIEIQKREHLTDTKLAEKLGIHAISWNRIKKGRAGYSEEFIKKAVKAFPEVAPAVLLDLFGEDWKKITLNLFKQILSEME